MKIGKLIISTIIAAIVLFLLGWLFYGGILMAFFTKHFGTLHRNPSSDMKLWAIAVGCLLQGFFLSMIYPVGYKGGSPFFEGLKFGLYLGLLFGVPLVFFNWAEMPINYKAAIVESAVIGFNILIAGIAVGLVHGKIEKPTTP